MSVAARPRFRTDDTASADNVPDKHNYGRAAVQLPERPDQTGVTAGSAVQRVVARLEDLAGLFEVCVGIEFYAQ